MQGDEAAKTVDMETRESAIDLLSVLNQEFSVDSVNGYKNDQLPYLLDLLNYFPRPWRPQ